MQVAYYPGCTLYQKAQIFNYTVKETAKILGIELKELNKWYCCGAVFSQVKDNLINLVASVRNLITCKKENCDKLMMVCSGCYNTHKRVNKLIIEDEVKRQTICDFLEEEYNGEIEILHYLELLKKYIGFNNIRNKIKQEINLKVGCYYGCLLLRPRKEIGFDNYETPTILEEFVVNCLVAEVINFPKKIDCCGSYLIVHRKEDVINCSYSILQNALKNGAEAIITSCPLCFFNLEYTQKEKAINLPIFYFTELLHLALGLGRLNFEETHIIEPYSLLIEKKII